MLVDCHLFQKVKDAVLRIMVLSSLARQPLLRYPGPLTNVHHMSKRINYPTNAFLLPKYAYNGKKIIKKVEGQKKSKKEQPITIRNASRDSYGTPYIKAYKLYFHHSTSYTHSIKKGGGGLRSSSTLSHCFKGLVITL